MTTPPLPPPRSADRLHDGGPATESQHRAAVVALAASISGFVVFPVLGPIVGVVVAFAVLWSLRAAPRNSTSRLAAVAAAVGAAGIAVPLAALVYLRDGGSDPLLVAVLGTVAVVTGAAMHLAHLSSRSTLLVSAGSTLAVVATAAAAIGGVLLAVWFLIVLVRIVFSTLVGVVNPAMGAW